MRHNFFALVNSLKQIQSDIVQIKVGKRRKAAFTCRLWKSMAIRFSTNGAQACAPTTPAAVSLSIVGFLLLHM